MRAIEAVNRVFKNMPEKKSMCGQYVYQMAKVFVLGGESNPKDIGHGSCGTEEYYDALKSLHYREVLNKTVSKEYIIDDIRNGEFPEGAVIAYKAIDDKKGDNIHSAFKYGHTQFYTGNKDWATSVRDNYGCDFVYNKIESEKWNYRVFLPPKDRV